MKTSTRIIGLSAIIGGAILLVNTHSSTTVTREPVGTTTPVVQVEVSDDVEKARKQLEEATSKLNAEEAKILADTEAASTTAHAEVAAIMAEFDAKKAENDKRLDEINAIRSSF